MKFGKEFRIHLEETLPEWRDKYLRYKPLKKLLKTLPSDPSFNPPDDERGGGNPPPPSPDFFIGLLNQELEKFNDFYVDQEEDFVIFFQELKERIERVREKSGKDGMLTSASEFSKEVMDIRKDFVAIHGQIVLLQNYSSLNFAGLVKILKKYDKRTGGLLCIPFTQLALHQPFFATEPLTRLVSECEANLELLFPTKAEVIESASTVQEQTRVSSSTASNVSPDRSLQLGERNVDIYRGTLAAIRAIQGLKRASSTSNPLSLSSLWENQYNDDTGAITAENSSASTSPQTNEEYKQKASHSPI